MASFRIKGRLDGLQEVLANLDGVAKKVRKKAVRTGVAKAGRLLARAAKANSPQGGTGQLKRSIGSKVKTYPSGVVVAIVGPRKGFAVVDAKGKKHDPANIAHLVEFGHAGPHPAPAHPFLRPAFDTSKGACLQAIADEIAAVLG